MSISETVNSLGRNFPSLDVNWHNIVFSLRTAAAAISALALAYWLELSDPQWATLTVYILAQPTVGAALAKGIWRAVGTVSGGVAGLVLVGLLSQAPELLVAAVALLVGVSFYGGARLRNYTAYGALLAGYTMLLVAYEGSTHPLNAWSVAIDRTTEILIGIACGTLASQLIFPRYAGDVLRAAQDNAIVRLARYAAAALHLTTPPAVFARLRRQMVADVVSFDALRSYTLFETPELRANEDYLRRSVSEFLRVLSIARGLYLRLDEFGDEGAHKLRSWLRPTLDEIALRIGSIASVPGLWNDRQKLRNEMVAARTTLNRSKLELQGLAGKAPFDQLVNAWLILNRVRDLLDGLALALVAGAASHHNHDASQKLHKDRERNSQDHREAILLALRAALATSILTGIWMATTWNEGFMAVSGGAIMLFFGVNQDNPQAAARSYLYWSTAGILLAYLTIVFVLPYLQGFEALSIVLMLILLPAGLMAASPSHAWAGIALGGWTVAEISSGNVFAPNELAYVNNAAALIVGMLICLAIISVMPVTSYARRAHCWRSALGLILPEVARGGIAAREGAREIIGMLAALLPRLALERERDEQFLRGTLSIASCAIEIGRLRESASNPDMPPSVAFAIKRFLERFADTMEKLPASIGGHRDLLTDAVAIISETRAELAAQMPASEAATSSILNAAASLRFLADRFSLDRAYLERKFAED